MGAGVPPPNDPSPRGASTAGCDSTTVDTAAPPAGEGSGPVGVPGLAVQREAAADSHMQAATFPSVGYRPARQDRLASGAKWVNAPSAGRTPYRALSRILAAFMGRPPPGLSLAVVSMQRPRRSERNAIRRAADGQRRSAWQVPTS
jgi:hypothetical protein